MSIWARSGEMPCLRARSPASNRFELLSLSDHPISACYRIGAFPHPCAGPLAVFLDKDYASGLTGVITRRPRRSDDQINFISD